MNKSQWRKEHTTTFSIRVNNDNGFADRIKQAAQDSNISVAQFFIQGALAKLSCMTTSNGCMTSSCVTTSNGCVTTTENSVTTESSGCVTTSNGCNAPNPTPTVPTYIPTDPLDIVAEAFYHQPYATLSFHGRGCCDFIADHPIMGPEMVLDAPPEYIKAGIEYMNNPTPVPIYQPKPSENNSKLTEIINTVNSYRAAKDEAFRQSLMEAETLYPDDGDSFFYCDSDDDAQEEVPAYSEEISEEN